MNKHWTDEVLILHYYSEGEGDREHLDSCADCQERLRLLERTRPGVLYADLRACHDYDAGLTAAAGVRCPVLLIAGQRDQMVLARNTQSLIAALGDKRVITIAGCGHSLMIEAPDAVLDALRSFLAPTPPSNTGGRHVERLATDRV